MSDYKQTETNRVIRNARLASYDRETIYSILDEGYLCYVGFSAKGQPFVIPTLYTRSGDSLLIHGSAVSRMLNQLETGIETCVTVAHVDGIVLARSAFHHAMNYRSAVVFGTGCLIKERDKKLAALKAISENLICGRWEDSRQPTEKELNITHVIEISIREASAKIRSGDPGDDKKDYDLPIWAGVLPVETAFGIPVADSQLMEGIELPDYLKQI